MHYCLKSWRLDAQFHWIGSLFSYHITPIYNLCSTQAGLQFCTYEVSIEFGSMLLPQDGRPVVPFVSSFVEGFKFAAVNIAHIE